MRYLPLLILLAMAGCATAPRGTDVDVKLLLPKVIYSD